MVEVPENKQPLLTGVLEGTNQTFLIDTGASVSTVGTIENAPPPLSTRTLKTVGFSGKTQTQKFTEPLTLYIMDQEVKHSFLYAPHCPVPLLGRDLLRKLKVTITCGPEGLKVYTSNSPPPPEEQIMLLEGEDPEAQTEIRTRIYWYEFIPATCSGGMDMNAHLLKKNPLQKTYVLPADPYHCTMNVVRTEEETYDEGWTLYQEGQCQEVTLGDVIQGEEGVAAVALLTTAQWTWYTLGEEGSYPHMTMMVVEGGQSKALGPMIRRAVQTDPGDWLPTETDGVYVNRSGTLWRYTNRSINQAVGRRVERTRVHLPQKEEMTPEVENLCNQIKHLTWAEGPYDVGHTPQHSIHVEVRLDASPIWKPQYRLKPDQIEGIRDTIAGLLQAGVLRHAWSPWNTPLFPVCKADGKSWRLVHDLQEVNKRTVGGVERVPNPRVALTQVNPDHEWFSVVDLANAFFCLPLHEDSQDIFAFTYEGQQYTYTRMPQGFRSTPTIFNACLKQDLKDLPLPEGVVLIQYVDDILLAAPTKGSCMEATMNLLQRVSEKGYKLKKSKLQLVKPSILFLGIRIGGNRREISTAHLESISAFPKPTTVAQMLSFLGLTGYSRNYIPEYVDRTTLLRALVKEAGCRNLKGSLRWNPQAEGAFKDLKTAMNSAMALAAPDYEAPFHLDVTEKGGTVNAILWQKQRGDRKVLYYLSSQLDGPEKGLPECGRALAAIARALEKTDHITTSHPTVVHTSHGVKSVLDCKNFTMTTAARQTKLDGILGASHLSYSTTGVNMTSTLPSPGDGEPHDCVVRIRQAQKIRADLEAEVFEHPDLILYTDGCCYKTEKGDNVASWAVVSARGSHYVTERGGILEQPASAQKAELHALVEGLKLGVGKRVVIFTDSNYCYSLAHLDATAIIQRKMATAVGAPVKHEHLIQQLLYHSQGPTRVAIIHCKGHDKSQKEVARGNHAADQAAKKAGGYVEPATRIQAQMTLEEETQMDGPGERNLTDMQTAAGPYEISVWEYKGAMKDWKRGVPGGEWEACIVDQMPPPTAKTGAWEHARREKTDMGEDSRRLVASTRQRNNQRLCPDVPDLSRMQSPEDDQMALREIPGASPSIPGIVHRLYGHGSRPPTQRVQVYAGDCGQLLQMGGSYPGKKRRRQHSDQVPSE